MTNSFDQRSTLAASDNQAEQHLTSLLDRIPGYSGYRHKESKRDADRAVRDDIAQGLSVATERVERVARDLADRRKMPEVSAVDSWVQSLRHLKDRIQSASYGYGGVFGDTSVDSAALDQLRDFDESLLARLQSLEDPVEALEAALVAEGDYQTAVDRGLTATRELSTTFEARTSVMATGEASSDTNVLQALDSSETPRPRESWQLDAGDAVSILGDDFLVDARLHVGSGTEAFRLFRLGERAAGRWLYVPFDATKSEALVHITTDSSKNSSSESLASGAAATEMIGPAGDPRSAEATYAVQSPSENPNGRTITVEWPNERLLWTGDSLAPGDLTIYGPASQQP